MAMEAYPVQTATATTDRLVARLYRLRQVVAVILDGIHTAECAGAPDSVVAPLLRLHIDSEYLPPVIAAVFTLAKAQRDVVQLPHVYCHRSPQVTLRPST